MTHPQPDDPLSLNAGDMAAAVRAGHLRATDLIARSLARARLLQERCNCFVLILEQEAMQAAARADQAIAEGRQVGPLHGVPVAIKDLTPTAGHLTTLGSWSSGEHRPDRSALIVTRLQAAGAIVIGKTTTPEFAYSSFTASPRWGVTRNPWDVSRTPGGSSGGSGAAVSGGCAPFAEGTDMGGSVRIPAAQCGVVGLKPSLGRIPMTILPSLFDDISHFGPLARSVDDAIRFMQAVAGPSDEDPLSLDLPFDAARAREPSVRGRRFALSLDLGYYAVDPGVQRAVRAAAAALADRGAVVEEVALPWTRALNDGWAQLWGVFMSAYFGDRLEAHRDRMDPFVVRLIEAGRRLGATEYKRVELLRSQMWRELMDVLARCDALLCPTCAAVAPPATQTEADWDHDLPDGRFRGLDLTAPFNLVSACPAISVPCGIRRASAGRAADRRPPPRRRGRAGLCRCAGGRTRPRLDASRIGWTMRCDLLIRDATILDGGGGPRRRGDVAVSGERIAGVGALGDWTAEAEIDAAGLAIAPGFIDAHTHDDRAVLCGPACMLCKMSQGVTTVVAGNCGISLSPAPMRARPIPPLDLLGDESWFVFDSFAAYAERLLREKPPVNVVALVGHMSLRIEAMGGDVMRAASDAEAARMQARLAEALDQGASGFSTGLYYPASAEAPTAEVIAVAEALRGRGGLYVTHMRDEGVGVLDSIAETLGIGRAVGAPVVISHHKCANPENYGRSATTLAAIDAGAAAQDVAFDSYPYAAGSTVLMPEKVREDVPARITWSAPHPEVIGRYLADIAAEWGVAQAEAARRLLPAGAVLFQMDEADVRRILAHPRGMVGSDGLPHDARPHPRLWGTFPRVLGHYARDERLFSLETAIHKMTGRTAEVFGLVDRGVIRAGAYADLVLFDPATVRDTATYDDPARAADGILRTWVNGQAAYVHGQGAVGAHGGRLVTRGRA